MCFPETHVCVVRNLTLAGFLDGAKQCQSIKTAIRSTAKSDPIIFVFATAFV